MKIIETEIDGLLIIEPDVFKDSRGYFLETYTSTKYNLPMSLPSSRTMKLNLTSACSVAFIFKKEMLPRKISAGCKRSCI
jgi:hypothetical protein